jgi:tryptophan halogenase
VLRASAAADPGAPVAIRPGRRPEPWLRNCVALGDASVAMEPLEWTGLHLAHSAIDRLIAKLPDRDCSPVELWDYNRETRAEADRARDFVTLHYVRSARPKDPFWREAAGIEPPPSLAHTLSLFEERGRLPIHEEETFSRHSWVAVMLGQGAIPRRADPLIDVTPPEQSERTMAQIRDAIAAMVPNLPTQGAYLRNLMQRAPR